MKDIFAERSRRVPYVCLWSVFTQMLKVYLDTIDAGLISTDAHHSNWFIEKDPPTSYPKIILGDFGINMFQPTDPKDQDALGRWFQAAHDHLKIWVIQQVRVLIAMNTLVGTGREQIDSLLWRGETGFEVLAMLVHFVNKVDDIRPSDFLNGEAWIRDLKRTYGQMMTCQQNPARIPPEPSIDHIRCRATYYPVFRPIIQVLQEMSTLNVLDADGNHPACLWLIARVDNANHVIDISRPPRMFSRVQYDDVTNWDLVPAGWRESHERTLETVRHYIPDFGMENMGADVNLQGDLYGGSVY